MAFAVHQPTGSDWLEERRHNGAGADQVDWKDSSHRHIRGTTGGCAASCTFRAAVARAASSAPTKRFSRDDNPWSPISSDDARPSHLAFAAAGMNLADAEGFDDLCDGGRTAAYSDRRSVRIRERMAALAQSLAAFTDDPLSESDGGP